MPDIYVIAGPPGIGKSTMGKNFVPVGLDIIQKDEIIRSHQALPFKLNQLMAVQKWIAAIDAKLEAGHDLAFELNLGKIEHYEFLLKKQQKSVDHKLHVILFFTDDLGMCKSRAEARFKKGLHDVDPVVLENMYLNTLPLLRYHLVNIDDLTLIDVRPDNSFCMIAKYWEDGSSYQNFASNAKWFKESFLSFIEGHIRYPAAGTGFSR